MDKQAATDIAVKSLQYLGQDENELLKFVMESGLGVSDLQNMTDTDALLGGVLGYYMTNEPLLLAFTSNAGIDPALVSQANMAFNPGTPAEG